MKTKKRPRLEVRDAGAMGRGVFAGTPISKGQLIEACPVIPLSAGDEAKLGETALASYLFAWSDGSHGACLALGLGSLCNHSTAPNAIACRCESETWMEFIALRDIAADEQVFVDYCWHKGEYDFDPEVCG
jgi:SET domain-containing protein